MFQRLGLISPSNVYPLPPHTNTPKQQKNQAFYTQASRPIVVQLKPCPSRAVHTPDAGRRDPDPDLSVGKFSGGLLRKGCLIQVLRTSARQPLARARVTLSLAAKAQPNTPQ